MGHRRSLEKNASVVMLIANSGVLVSVFCIRLHDRMSTYLTVQQFIPVYKCFFVVCVEIH